MKRLWPIWLAAGLAALGWDISGHYLGYRFAIGTWPVPQGTPWTYQLWSGFIPALTIVTLLGSVISLYHVHNCHHDGCWRIGKHRISGTPWCTHHQAEAQTAADASDPVLQQLTEVTHRLGQLIDLLSRPNPEP
jgi:hypothetical protein